MAVPQQPGGEVCPNCSKPVRREAKFCNNCGFELTKVDRQEMIPPTEPGITPVPEPTAQAVPPADVKAPEIPSKPSRGKVWIWALLGLIVIVCGLVAAAAYLYVQDPLGLFAAATETLTPTSQPTDTAAPQITETPPQALTETPFPTNTVVIPTVSPTLSLPGTTEPVSTAETETAGPTETSVQPTASPQTIVIFEDDFSGNLDTKWNLWGVPEAETDKLFDKPFLKLTGAPNMAGVTSLILVPLRPGVVIQFAVLLPQEAMQDTLALDWDPGESFREPGDGSGLLRAMIQNEQVTFEIPSPLNCILPLEGERDHVYMIKILEEMRVSFEVDGQVCPVLESDLRRGGGRVSISGVGAVDYIKVTR